LVDLHGADLCREGTARTASHNYRCEQNAQLAEHSYADCLDREYLGAERFKLLNALVGDYDANQEAQDADDSERPYPDLVHLAHYGAYPQPLGMKAGLERNHQNLAEKFTKTGELGIHVDQCVPNLVEPMQQPVQVQGRRRRFHVFLHHLEQVGMTLIGSDDFGLCSGACQLEDFESARGVETPNAARVDRAHAAPPGLL